LYQLVPGVCQHSFAVECAKIARIDAGVINRANDLLFALKHNCPLQALQFEPAAANLSKIISTDQMSEAGVPSELIKERMLKIRDAFR
jgi:DNA mismatch repair ATPase MutS